MEQKLKKLLIKELCSRLPYSLKVKRPDDDSPDYVSTIDIDAGTLTVLYNGYTDKIEKFVPYLRPMASMTGEELKTFYKIEDTEHPVIWNIPQPNWHFSVDGIDWLNAHYFDYRGLIEKGLAVEAPEGMYNIKEK